MQEGYDGYEVGGRGNRRPAYGKVGVHIDRSGDAVIIKEDTIRIYLLPYLII